MASSVEVGTQDMFIVDCGEMFARYASSEHGVWHGNQPLRYEAAFGCYDRAQMISDLGGDVGPVSHMPATHQAYLDVVRTDSLSGTMSPYDLTSGEGATLLHDIGECTLPDLVPLCGGVIGDPAFGTKTDNQRMIEANIRKFMRERYYADVPGYFLDRIESLIAHCEDSPTHNVIECAHDTNSFKVGLVSGRIGLKSMELGLPMDKRVIQLCNMAKAVTMSFIGRIEHHSDTFIYARRLLDNGEPLYERILSEL